MGILNPGDYFEVRLPVAIFINLAGFFCSNISKRGLSWMVIIVDGKTSPVLGGCSNLKKGLRLLSGDVKEWKRKLTV